MIPGFDQEACTRRNRIAARRYHVEAAPFEFSTQLRGGPGRKSGVPKTNAAALKAINERANSELTEADVYIFWAEAGNQNYIADRFMFLGNGTLANVARDAEAGIAFMNSHRSGGLLTPAELPFGRTFGGEYDEEGRRATVGIYMLKGVKPNGDSGPSTDDLYRLIDGGTLFDVSLGLYGGDRVCDLCSHDVTAMADSGEFLCPHIPGTTYKMSESDRKAQRKRGVGDGVATYTVENARAGEVSGVFRGAVPGAGFRKAEALGHLPGVALLARNAYREMWETGGGPQAGHSLEQQADQALALVNDCIERAEQVLHLRSQDGRSLSASRWEQVQAIRDRIDGLLARRNTGLNALRRRVLQEQAAMAAALNSQESVHAYAAATDRELQRLEGHARSAPRPG